MSWLILFEILYVIVLVMVCLRIIYDTRSTTKTLGYLLFAIFVPVVGMVFYFFFGVNYRCNKMYSKKAFVNEEISKQIRENIYHYPTQTFTENDAAVKKTQIKVGGHW